MKWLRRYLDEESPALEIFVKVVWSLEERQLDTRTPDRPSPQGREACVSCLSAESGG